MAFSLLKKNGFKTAIISGEANSAIEVIAKKFDIVDVHQGIRNKLEVLKSIVQKYELTEDEFLYVGDDVNDFDSLVYAKHALTVPNAVEKVKKIENIQITHAAGGDGAAARKESGIHQKIQARPASGTDHPHPRNRSLHT